MARVGRKASFASCVRKRGREGCRSLLGVLYSPNAGRKEKEGQSPLLCFALIMEYAPAREGGRKGQVRNRFQCSMRDAIATSVSTKSSKAAVRAFRTLQKGRIGSPSLPSHLGGKGLARCGGGGGGASVPA